MQLGLGAEISDIDIAIGIRSNHHNLVANHLRRGWVGSMGGCGDQTDIAMPLPIGRVVFADGQQAGIFTLRAGIGLLADGVIAGDVAKLGIQILKHLMIAARLIDRHERVQIGKFWPSYRDHLNGGIELHRTAAQRNHGAIQRQISVC